MKGAVIHGARDVRYEERADPKIVEPTDAILSLDFAPLGGERHDAMTGKRSRKA